MFSVENESDANEDEISSAIETCWQTAYPSDSAWWFIYLQINQADHVASKLNNFILNGTIPKDGIFYRYLSDVLQMYLISNHKYHPDLNEFFSTIIYLGGRRTFNFIRGPMCYGKGSGFWDKRNVGKSKMHLGGLSESSCKSRKNLFTAKPAILKCLSLLQYKLMNWGFDASPEPIINNKNLLVYPCVYSNDRTALKPEVEFDVVSKTNVRLPVTVDMDL